MDTSVGIPNDLQQFLLSSGVIAALLFLGADVLAGKLLAGYNFTTQSMGEIGAAGSPMRLLFVILSIFASGFMIAFGIGIWKESTPSVLPCIVAGLIICNATAGLVATLFFPNQFGVRPEFISPNVLIMFFSVLCFIFAMVFGAIAFHGWMRTLSITIPSAYIVLAIIRFSIASNTATSNVVTVGVQERTMAYSYLLWIIALSVYLPRVSGD